MQSHPTQSQPPTRAMWRGCSGQGEKSDPVSNAGRIPRVPACLRERREMSTKSNSGFGLLNRAGHSPELKLCLQFKVITELCITKE